MFSADHGDSRHGHHIDESSFLYSDQTGLLRNTMLISESGIKVEASAAKDTLHPFGSFETLGIYKEYDDSGLSSVQPDEENGNSDHGGNHGTSKDDVSIISSTFNATSAPSNATSQSPIPNVNFAQLAMNQQVPAPRMSAAGQSNSHALPSPLQHQLLADPPQLDSTPEKESLKRKRSVFLFKYGDIFN
jgi:hypothetical protein